MLLVTQAQEIALQNVMTGNLMANALILGGTETNIAMDENGTNVRVKPGGKIVLQASGASGAVDKPVLNCHPSIDNGSTGIQLTLTYKMVLLTSNDRPIYCN